MKRIMRDRMFYGISVALLTGFFMIPAAAQKSVAHARDEAREATELLTSVMSNPDKSIPRALLRRAQAVALFTNVKKGGFIVGGTGGDGVIARRTGKTWGPPAYYTIGGMDIGLQIGAKKSDFILIFMTDASLKDLLNDDLDLGAGAGLAAGPVGKTAAITTAKDSNIYVYNRSSGAFGGATVGGGSIKANNSINEDLYKMKGGAVLTNASRINTSTLPAELNTLSITLAKFSN